MGNSGQRRFKKEVKTLKKLAEEDTGLFLKVWNKRVRGWLSDIHQIAADVRDTSDEKGNQRNAKRDQLIGSVAARVENLIRECGERVETLVGQYTRGVIDAETAKMIAVVYEPRAYRMIAHRQYTPKGKRATRRD